ncbi:MAG: HAD hydrolase-like protein [Gammaproteobacteria bacterium]|nr:HAD hydrolase-like protein [Gammaproteobacteria bacterium]
MYFLFDFDGTLVDSFDCVIGKFNLLAKEFSFKTVSDEELSTLRDMSSRQLISHLQIPLFKIPSIIFKARELLHDDMPNLLPFDNLREVLIQLKERQIFLNILTSNSKQNVSQWLEYNNMAHLFGVIHSQSGFFGKKYSINNFLKRYQIEKQQLFYVGDETRDIEAAKKTGIASIAVTWGFNSEKILAQYEPDYMVHKPEDLLTLASALKN